MHFVGLLIWRRNQLATVVEDEGGAGAPNLELGKKIREPAIFDDDGEDTLPLLIDIDRACECDRWTLPDRMVKGLEPLRSPGPHRGLEPGLVGDMEIGRHELALFEFDISRNDRIFVDPTLAGMIGQRYLHHLQMFAAKLVRGEKRAVGPAEGHPGDRRMRLQL